MWSSRAEKPRWTWTCRPYRLPRQQTDREIERGWHTARSTGCATPFPRRIRVIGHRTRPKSKKPPTFAHLLECSHVEPVGENRAREAVCSSCPWARGRRNGLRGPVLAYAAQRDRLGQLHFALAAATCYSYNSSIGRRLVPGHQDVDEHTSRYKRCCSLRLLRNLPARQRNQI